jgi:hypothetical protein
MMMINGDLKMSRGRPEKFNATYTKYFKSIVRKHGLKKGHVLINKEGVFLPGKKGNVCKSVSISLNTLSKYVKREDMGGKPVLLRVGRPVG